MDEEPERGDEGTKKREREKKKLVAFGES